jgi:hypothetical protein
VSLPLVNGCPRHPITSGLYTLLTQVRNKPNQKKHESKGSAPGLKPGDVFPGSWFGGSNPALPKITYNLGNFLLLNPDFFFCASGPAQKPVPVPFFGGVVFMTYSFFQIFFLSPGDFNGQWGRFRS